MPAFKEIKVRYCPCGCGNPCRLYMNGDRFKAYSRYGINCPTAEKGRHSANGKAHYGRKHPRYRPIGSRRTHESRDNLVYMEVKIADPDVWEFEHRVVLAKKLGRNLEPDEHAHHINGDTLDNRPENLTVLTKPEHKRLHNRERMAGPWAIHFDHCQSCLSIKYRHLSRGLCTSCYEKEYRLANLEKVRAYDRARLKKGPLGWACIECGRSDRAYGSHGRCHTCESRWRYHQAQAKS